MSRSTSGGLRWMLALAPAVVPLLIILHWGVDIHFWDEWDPGLAGLFIKFQQHQLSFADLVAQHNEHRMLVPRLIFLILNSLTQWNNIAYLICIWVFVLAASLMIFGLYRNSTDHGGETWIVWFLCNLVIFTPNQEQTWLWGMGIPNVLPGFLFLAALWAAVSAMSPWRKVGIMALLSAAATYSNGNGLLCWPLLAIVPAFSRSWRQLIVWTVGFILILCLYFFHYSKPTFGGVTGDQWTITQFIGFFVAFLGNAFSTAIPGFPQASAIVCGSAMLALFLIAAGYFVRAWGAGRREYCARLLPWFLVGGFALLNDFLAARSRAGFGIQQALETRYVCASVFLPVSLIALAALICRDLGVRTRCRILAGLLILAQAAVFPGALAACGEWNVSQRGVKAAVLLSQVLPGNPQLVKVFPSPGILVEEAEALNGMGYIRPPLIGNGDANLIRASDPAAAGEARGRLEGRAPGALDSVNLIGWAISQAKQRPVDGVFITYENERGESIICGMAEMGMKSPGIADELHESGYLWSGWHANLPAGSFPATPGTLRLRAWALDAETGRAVPLDGVYWLVR